MGNPHLWLSDIRCFFINERWTSVICITITGDEHFFNKRALMIYIVCRQRSSFSVTALVVGVFVVLQMKRPNCANYRFTLKMINVIPSTLLKAIRQATCPCQSELSAKVFKSQIATFVFYAVNWKPSFCQPHRILTDCNTGSIEDLSFATLPCEVLMSVN